MSSERRAAFRFYAELNDFLPPAKRFRTVKRTFRGAASVKDLIEAEGVPHTEVDLVIAGGESVDFSYRVRDGDRVAVYPVFEAFDIARLTRLRPEPLRVARFVADGHLGGLARALRLLGFDTLYDPHCDDPELAEASRAGRRILLTRDVGLLKRRMVTHGYFVRARTARDQVIEVVRRLQLGEAIRPFSRCLECNGQLAAVSKESVEGQLEEHTRRDHDEFMQCAECRRIYWRGSHYARLNEVVTAIRDALRTEDGDGRGEKAG